MGEQYLIDTNIVISYLDAKIPVKGMQFMNAVVDATPNLSVITKIELLGYNNSDSALLLLIDFINASIVFDLTDDVVDKTIVLRKLHKVKLPDAIIAATALASNLILITHNKADFKKINGLQIVDPFEL